MRIGQLIVPVDSIDTALEFYRDMLGLQLRFRDGDRYAAMSDGSATLALAAPNEQPSAAITVGMKVDDVVASAAGLRDRGATVGDVHRGEHELRVAVTDPFGNALVLYGPLPA